MIAPLILLGLVLLPLLYWLLRALPPQPQRAVFGGTYFLKKLTTAKRKPVTTPLIILLLRLLAFAALLLGLAGPLLGQRAALSEGPRTVVIADGWDAAQHWSIIKDLAKQEIAGTGGPLTLIGGDGRLIGQDLDREAALSALDRIVPRAEVTDWAAIEGAVAENAAQLSVLTGGLAPKDDRGLGFLAGARMHLPEEPTYALGEPIIGGDELRVPLIRSRSAASATKRVHAVSADGRRITSAAASFNPGDTEAEASFRLPLELRNTIARFEVEGLRSAGTTRLLGSDSRRTLVGLVGSQSESLRDGAFYIARALEPVSQIIEGPLLGVLQREPGMIVLDDVGTFQGAERDALTQFVREGGLLLRFAGGNLLTAEGPSPDPLLPAPLLRGDRSLGGALTWADPQAIARIDEASPLADIGINETIPVRRQVLTQPGGAEVWVSLEDGTPLISARREGAGLTVLVHVSALPTWSDLPVSGLFPVLLQRLSLLARTSAAETLAAEGPLPAQQLLQGDGSLRAATDNVPPLGQDRAGAAPGLYGEGGRVVAVNAFGGEELRTLTRSDLPSGISFIHAERGGQRDLTVPLLTLALILLILDGFLSLRRFSGPRSRPGAVAASLVLAIFALPDTADAQIRPPLSPKASEAALALRFAYVGTGDAALDRLSQAALSGLSREATRRSALEPAEPQKVDLDRDELSVYTLLYWPIRPSHQPPSESALQRLEEYMAGGGLLIVDTADGANPNRSTVLAETMRRLDAPPLEPLPEDSVLLFSFYRLDDLHGRNSGGRVWVEAIGGLDQRRDGVPSLIVAGRDWASAWALDDRGIPLRPAGPGGEARREYAFRAGINMAMVAVTGNYKADQADVQNMLDSLGSGDER
ncbi:MAG: DUF4159 domain-containing protein [Parvularcula sp.]|jgi:hypothetical protein|nr:DUF4159 domain-containing protein [Parvularcula sp.]